MDISVFDKTTGLKRLLCLVAVLALSACATSPRGAVGALMQQANDAMIAGAQEKAVELLTQATKTDPTDKEVWVKLAQAQFDKHDYPKAVSAATEALARNPDSQQAHSIIFVSSMRLAVNSLNDIRKDSPISEDSKSEAETLVKTLRDTLGEAILIPEAKRAPKPRPKPPVAKADVPTPSPGSKPVPAATASTASNDPFGALR